MLVHDTVGTAATLDRLKALGVRLALDDFGTGYSSLSYLRRFPLDIPKIDKSFIDGIATSTEEGAVAEAVIQLGRTLDLEVVAEGLENAEQVTIVAALGCPLGKGYHFARPVPAGLAQHLAGVDPHRADPHREPHRADPHRADRVEALQRPVPA